MLLIYLTFTVPSLYCYHLFSYLNIILNCGKVYIISKILIDNGVKALVGTTPWNVRIYRLNKTNSNHYLICVEDQLLLQT